MTDLIERATKAIDLFDAICNIHDPSVSAHDRRVRAMAKVIEAALGAVELHGPYGYLIKPIGLNEEHWYLSDDPSDRPDEEASVPLYAKEDLPAANPTPPGWPDPLESPQAEAIRNGKLDDTEIRNLFDCMERELRLHRERAANPAQVTEAMVEAAAVSLRPELFAPLDADQLRSDDYAWTRREEAKASTLRKARAALTAAIGASGQAVASEDAVGAAWDSIADEHNQWPALSLDERNDFMRFASAIGHPAQPGWRQVGWAYNDKRWDEDRWHVCGMDSKPRSSDGRLIQPIFIAAPQPK